MSNVSRRVFVSLLLIAAMAVPVLARGKKGAGSTEPGKYKEWGPDIDEVEIVKKFKASNYTAIVVQPFATTDVKLPDKDDKTYKPVKEVLESAAEGFVQGLRGSVDQKVTVSDKPVKRSDTLIIRGKVMELDPGSKAARYLAGFGAGAARAKVQGEIVDAKSGQVLARFTQERRSGVDMMDGDYRELMQRNLNAIGEDVSVIVKAF